MVLATSRVSCSSVPIGVRVISSATVSISEIVARFESLELF